jgi:hypothetical protein
MQVACMPQIEAGQLLDRCLRAVNYWRTKASTGTEVQRREAADRLRVFIEVLARMMVRATPEQAKTAFSLALVLAKTPVLQHLWLSESLTHLVDYSLKSIPQSQHHELLLDAMLFPLDVELEGGIKFAGRIQLSSRPERGARTLRLTVVLTRSCDEPVEVLNRLILIGQLVGVWLRSPHDIPQHQRIKQGVSFDVEEKASNKSSGLRLVW